jgi:hypothetical protein
LHRATSVSMIQVMESDRNHPTTQPAQRDRRTVVDLAVIRRVAGLRFYGFPDGMANMAATVWSAEGRVTAVTPARYRLPANTRLRFIAEKDDGRWEAPQGPAYWELYEILDGDRAGDQLVIEIPPGVRGHAPLEAVVIPADTAPPRAPLDAAFSNGEPVPGCWRTHGFPRGHAANTGFWAVHPVTPWLVVADVTLQHCPDASTVVQVTLPAGTRLSLVAISPARDRNQGCGDMLATWSAHAFRVETGPWQGHVVEWRSERNAPPSVARIQPLEPATPVSFAERVEGRLDRFESPPTG